MLNESDLQDLMPEQEEQEATPDLVDEVIQSWRADLATGSSVEVLVSLQADVNKVGPWIRLSVEPIGAYEDVQHALQQQHADNDFASDEDIEDWANRLVSSLSASGFCNLPRDLPMLNASPLAGEVERIVERLKATQARVNDWHTDVSGYATYRLGQVTQDGRQYFDLVSLTFADGEVIAFDGSGEKPTRRYRVRG